MDRYKCRLCFESFINGRALSGHMRSHEEEQTSQLNDDVTESDTSSSSDEEDHEYPKMNHLQIVDDDGDGLEYERESINPTRRRSKRTRKLGSFDFDFKKLKTNESVTEPDHYSSASDTTTEKDLAICLIMLSRDKWKQQKKMEIQYRAGSMESDDEGEDYRSSKIKGRGRFKCETCGKLFKSYQALGGHRASHKKNKTITKTEQVKTEYEIKKIHECPICFRVFSSGQALGGHKRSHGSNIGGARLSVNQIVRIDKEEVMEKQRIIDLNLPAPNEEDETSIVFDEW